MAILLSYNCIGREFKFITNGGELLTKGSGKQYQGIIALQALDDNEERLRITFVDAKNAISDFVKKIARVSLAVYNNNVFKMWTEYNRNYLCCFDFSRKELKDNKKLIKMQVQQVGFDLICGIMCYDFSTMKGVSYILDSMDELEIWAKKLNISTYEWLDYDGNVESVDTF